MPSLIVPVLVLLLIVNAGISILASLASPRVGAIYTIRVVSMAIVASFLAILSPIFWGRADTPRFPFGATTSLI